MTKPMSFMQGQQNVRLVPIPPVAASSRKGTTMYDQHFTKLLEFAEAMQVPDHEFEAVRKAATRFLTFRELSAKVSVRQKKDHRTKTYMIWFLDQPPIKRKKT